MLSKTICQKIINIGLDVGADFVDIFAEKTKTSNTNMSKNLIKNINVFEDFGVGIRFLDKDFQTYGYTNITTEDSLLKLAKKLSLSIKANKTISFLELKEFNYNVYAKALKPFDSIDGKIKADYLKHLSNTTYQANKLVDKVDISMHEYNQEVLIANSNGLYVSDTRNRARLIQSAIVKKEDETNVGRHNLGASQGWEFFENIDIKDFAHKTIKKATDKLGAINCPAGMMPVILSNGFGGVIFHEACGHGLEATSVSKKTSVFTDKLGQQIASPILSATDDGTIKNEWGTLNIDDEGTQSQKNTLIKDGVLTSYLADIYHGRKMGIKSTGSGRKENYKFAPVARMNNTFINNGTSTPQDIIANTENGLYAAGMGGGSVNTTTGEFNFSVTEAFLIKNGKITTPVKGAKLIGKGLEVIKDIDMIGNDLDFGAGICGASSGGVPTSVGQPTIRVAKMLVGGQGND